MAADLDPRLAQQIRDCPKYGGWNELRWHQHRSPRTRALHGASIVALTLELGGAIGGITDVMIQGTWTSANQANIRLTTTRGGSLIRLCLYPAHGDQVGWHWKGDAFGAESDHEPVTPPPSADPVSPGVGIIAPEHLLYDIFCKQLHIEQYTRPKEQQPWHR